MMKQLTQTELLALMDVSVHAEIKSRAASFRATHLILFENQTMDSSSFGKRTVACCGPNNTYKTPQMAEGCWLNDLPSQRQYPVAYCEFTA